MSSVLNNLFAFALEFYRAPLQHQQQLHNYDPTSATFTRFLEIASRPATSDDLKKIAGVLNKSPDTLHSASLFLIRQLLFAEKGDHYQVLGLSRNASQEEIKKRYRALISLFHPDKNPEGEEWSQLYAPDLNEAYNVLKNSSKRNRYDLTLNDFSRAAYNSNKNRSHGQPKSSSAAQPSAARSRKRTTPPIHSFTPSPLESIHRTTLWQKHPHLTIWGTALVILTIIVLSVSLRNTDHVLDVATDQYGESPIDDRRSGTMMEDPYSAKSANKTDDALNFALKQTAPASYDDATSRNSEWDSPKDELDQAEVNALINKYMTEEERLKLSQEQTANESAATAELSTADTTETYDSYPDALADYKASQQSNPGNVASSQPIAGTRPDQNTVSPDQPVASAQPYSDQVYADQTVSKPADTKNETTTVATKHKSSHSSAKLPAVAPQKAIKKNTPAMAATVTKSTGMTDNPQAGSKTKVAAARPITASEGVSADNRKSAARLADDKVEYLVAQYIAAYDSGNLDKMTRLFTDNVKTDDGIGIAIIKRDYSNLFLNTAERHITVQNLQKTTTGEGRGNIRFDASVRVRNSQSSGWKYFSGSMVLDVIDSVNGLQITGLTHSITRDQ